MLESLADPRAWRLRLVLCLLLSLALHAALIQRYSWKAEVPDLRYDRITARITALPAPPAPPVPAMDLNPWEIGAAPQRVPRPVAKPRPQPDVAPPAPVEARPQPAPSAIGAPALDATRDSRVRGVVRVELESEPDPLPELELQKVRLHEHLPGPLVTRAAHVDTETIRVRFPAGADRRQGNGAVRLLVFVDENGSALEAALLEEEAPGAMIEAARAGVLAARFQPAQRDGRPVKGRLLVVVRFGYD